MDDFLPLDPVEAEDVQLTAAPVQERVILPVGYYDAEVTAAGAIPNNYWDSYVKDCEEKGYEPNPIRKQQIQLDFKVVHEGAEASLRHWVSPIISKGKKTSNLYALLEAMGIDPMNPPKTSELVGKKVKLNLQVQKKDDGIEYNKVVGGSYVAV